MKRKPVIDVSEDTLQRLVNCTTKGLNIAEADYFSSGMTFANGIGLLNLNFIFAELEKAETDDFLVGRFKRGSFEFALIFDLPSKTLITLVSKANVERLLHRKNIKTFHYVDSLITKNNNFEGDRCQMSIFDIAEDVPKDDERYNLCDKILNAINFNNVDKYIVCEYEIVHKQFALKDAKCSLYSNNFIELVTPLNLIKYLSPDYSNRGGTINENLLEEKEEIKNLDIKIKNGLKQIS